MLNVAHCGGSTFYNLFYTIMEEKDTLDVETKDIDPNSEDTVDYEALYKSQSEELQKLKEDAEKRKNRYKSSKAQENKSWDVSEDVIQSKIDESINTLQFYNSNKEANEFKEDIEGLVAKGYDRTDAYKVVLSDKKPELLLDEAKRRQLSGGVALSWVPIDDKKKPLSELTREDVKNMSEKERREYFPIWWESKKYYSE